MTADTISTVPNQPKEGRRVRTFREDDELWEQAAKKAAAAGRTMTDVLHEAIEDYIKGDEGEES